MRKSRPQIHDIPVCGQRVQRTKLKQKLFLCVVKIGLCIKLWSINFYDLPNSHNIQVTLPSESGKINKK